MGVMVKNKVARFFMDHGVVVVAVALAAVVVIVVVVVVVVLYCQLWAYTSTRSSTKRSFRVVLFIPCLVCYLLVWG